MLISYLAGLRSNSGKSGNSWTKQQDKYKSVWSTRIDLAPRKSSQTYTLSIFSGGSGAPSYATGYKFIKIIKNVFSLIFVYAFLQSIEAI